MGAVSAFWSLALTPPIPDVEPTTLYAGDTALPAKNTYTIEGGTVTLDLTRGQVCRLDLPDLALVAGYRWYAKWCPAGQCYQAASHRRENGSVMHMTSFLFGTVGTRVQIDHANHDTLDNRRENLRRCTQAQNLGNVRKHRRNKTGYKGVVFKPERGVFHANIRRDGKQCHVGAFAEARDAAVAYDRAAREHFGEFACLNFPEAAA